MRRCDKQDECKEPGVARWWEKRGPACRVGVRFPVIRMAELGYNVSYLFIYVFTIIINSYCSSACSLLTVIP